MVGSSVGSWWFTLQVRAVHSFVHIATIHIAAHLELRSAKLHWRKTIALLALLNCNRHSNMTF